MNDLMKFDFNGNAITTITDESGEPWFVAKEVAVILGLDNRETPRRLAGDQRRAVRRIRWKT